MTYEELPDELKAKLRALMEAGRHQEALALLHSSKPLTPEEQAKLDAELRKIAKSNKRFSKFINSVFIAAVVYLAYTYLWPM